MNRWLGALGDVGILLFGIFVLAVTYSRISDEHMGTSIKRPAAQIGQYR